MAYELFYAFTTTSTTTERLCFLAWFELDISFTILTLRRVYGPEKRKQLARNMFFLVTTGVAGLAWLTKVYPDDREQITAYWTGILLQLPIGWACLYFLWRDQDTKGHSLEIWYVSSSPLSSRRPVRFASWMLTADRLTRYIGCYTAYGVFFWRYYNVPQNWEYVGSIWSVGTIIVTLIPETIYPFLYLYIYNAKEEEERKAKAE